MLLTLDDLNAHHVLVTWVLYTKDFPCNQGFSCNYVGLRPSGSCFVQGIFLLLVPTLYILLLGRQHGRERCVICHGIGGQWDGLISWDKRKVRNLQFLIVTYLNHEERAKGLEDDRYRGREG